MASFKKRQVYINCDQDIAEKCRKAGMKLIYQNVNNRWVAAYVEIRSKAEQQQLQRYRREVSSMRRSRQYAKNPEAKKLDWAKKLKAFTGISNEEALQIADNRISYKAKQIDDLKARQEKSYSPDRERLINELEKAKPIANIRNEAQAYTILTANERHSRSDYDAKLAEAHRLEENGHLRRGSARAYAHANLTFEYCR